MFYCTIATTGTKRLFYFKFVISAQELAKSDGVTKSSGTFQSPGDCNEKCLVFMLESWSVPNAMKLFDRFEKNIRNGHIGQ